VPPKVFWESHATVVGNVVLALMAAMLLGASAMTQAQRPVSSAQTEPPVPWAQADGASPARGFGSF